MYNSHTKIRFFSFLFLVLCHVQEACPHPVWKKPFGVAHVSEETRVGDCLQARCWEGSCAAHLQLPVFVGQSRSNPHNWLYLTLLKV